MSKENMMRILIIDDNPAIHQDFIKILMSNKKANEVSNKISNLERNIFGKEGSKEEIFPIFEIDTATQGKEGVEKIAHAIQEQKPYALAFVDIRMPPGWDGIKTIKNIWQLDNNIQVVICTAYSDYTWEQTVAELGQRDNLLILKKPFDNIAVRQLACALTKKWELLQKAKEYTFSLEERVQERTESLKTSLSLMRATLESSADGVLVVDNNGNIKDYNTKFINMWNVPQPVLDKDFELLIEYLSDQMKKPRDFIQQIQKASALTEGVHIGNIKFKDKRIFEYYTQPYTLNTKNIGRVWSFRDVTRRVSLEEELQFQATHDLLTGLPNRVLLLDQISQAMKAADQNKTMFGILFLDLDRFKLINDSLNHEAGDEILRTLSKRLQAAIRQTDILARLGGDEFVMIVNNIHNEKDLNKIAKNIVKVLATPYQIYQHELTITSSIGVSIYPRDGKNIDVLLCNADIAMYRAKELGANQIQFYTEELNKQNLENLEKEHELRQAITNGEFILHYQPQFDIKTEKLVSVEALIRWQHPTKGIILPIDFIPLAEETGLIIPIGEWVINTACKQLKEWHEKGYSPIRVAINVATKQFRLYNLVEMISAVLKKTGLDAHYLDLELTENMIINNLDMIKMIKDLKKMGIQIVLDDFGTGYSSLNYLREIPVDRLKIDQSYVQNIESNRGDDVIIQAIISLAKSLKVEVLAEGVETEGQLNFLKSQKCGEVQGFYFSKPLSADECEKILKDDNKKLQQIV